MLLPELALRGRRAEIFELCLKSCRGQGSSILPAVHLCQIRAYSPRRIPTSGGTQGLQQWGWLLLPQTDTRIFGSLCGQRCNSLQSLAWSSCISWCAKNEFFHPLRRAPGGECRVVDASHPGTKLGIIHPAPFPASFSQHSLLGKELSATN